MLLLTCSSFSFLYNIYLFSAVNTDVSKQWVLSWLVVSNSVFSSFKQYFFSFPCESSALNSDFSVLKQWFCSLYSTVCSFTTDAKFSLFILFIYWYLFSAFCIFSARFRISNSSFSRNIVIRIPSPSSSNTGSLNPYSLHSFIILGIPVPHASISPI